MNQEEDKLSLNAEVYQKIKEDIVTLQLFPGQLLMVQQLAKELNVSRTPVREAMVTLKNEGFVHDADGRKFKVSEITWESMSNIYQARCVIECFAARIAALDSQKNPSILIPVRNNLQRMETCHANQDYIGYFTADGDFHNEIVKIVNNQILGNWLNNIHDMQLRIRYLTTGFSAQLETSLAEHTDIMVALSAGDAVTAEASMAAHLERAKTSIMKLRDQKIVSLPQTIIR
jgi:Transcriptional regulators